MARVYTTGFYAQHISEGWVFAFDAQHHDAVWVRTGLARPTDQDSEAVWLLPETEAECEAFCVRYNFDRITAREAQPYIREYLNNAADLLRPDSNIEITRDPNKAIQFVRVVKNFLMDLDEI